MVMETYPCGSVSCASKATVFDRYSCISLNRRKTVIKFSLNVTTSEYAYTISTDRNGGAWYTYDFDENNKVRTDEDFESYVSLTRHSGQASYRTSFGLEFTQAGISGTIKLPFAYNGKVVGLCGNYNQNKTDDYQCVDGTVFPYDGGDGYKLTNSEFQTSKCWMISGTIGPKPDTPIIDKCDNS